MRRIVMLCPHCSYRYNFWKFFCITNPFRIVCRGCQSKLRVKGVAGLLLSLVLITIALCAPLVYFMANFSAMMVAFVALGVGCGFGMIAEGVIYRITTLELIDPPADLPLN